MIRMEQEKQQDREMDTGIEENIVLTDTDSMEMEQAAAQTDTQGTEQGDRIAQQEKKRGETWKKAGNQLKAAGKWLTFKPGRHPLLFFLGLLAYYVLWVAMCIFFEVGAIGWLVVIVSAVVLIIVRETPRWKKETMVAFWLLAVFACTGACLLSKQVSIQGAITSKLLLAELAPERLPWTSGMSQEEISAYNRVNAQAVWSADGYESRQIDLGSFTMDLIVPEAEVGEQVVLFLHGGYYQYGVTNDYRDAAVHFSQATNNAKVLLPDYRCADRTAYPGALVDCMAAYNWLLERGYQGRDIILAGDGVGGGMALAMGLYFRDYDLPQPKAIVTWSALTDFKQKSHSVYSNRENDPIIGPLLNPNTPQEHPYVAEVGVLLEDPYLSPMNGDFSQLPPLLMQVGSREVLLDDTERLAKKAKQAGVMVQQTTYLAMFHNFQMAYSLRESEKAWQEIEEFITGLDEEAGK